MITSTRVCRVCGLTSCIHLTRLEQAESEDLKKVQQSLAEPLFDYRDPYDAPTGATKHAIDLMNKPLEWYWLPIAMLLCLLVGFVIMWPIMLGLVIGASAAMIVVAQFFWSFVVAICVADGIFFWR